MIMHPNFKNLPTHPNSSTKPLHLIIHILPLQLPSQLLRKFHHHFLLLRRELGPKPLLPAPIRLHHPLPPLSITSIVHQVGCHLGTRGGIGELAVEVSVAGTGGAMKAGGGGVVGGELTAAIGGVAAQVGCMVPYTLFVDINRLVCIILSAFHFF